MWTPTPLSPRVRRTALLLALAVAAACLTPVLLPQPAAHAAFGRLNEPNSTPVVGAPFKLDGYITRSQKKRRVILQRQVGSGWERIAATIANRRGKLLFTGVVLNDASTLRLVAPKTRNKWGKKLRRITSKTIEVIPVNQRAVAAVLPPIAQQGATPADPPSGSLVSATFTPPRPGRMVTLQQQTGDEWTKVAEQPQDASGHAVFDATHGAVYRAVAQPYGSAPEVVTNEVRGRSFTLDFDERFDGTSLPPVWKDVLTGLNAEGGRSCSQPDPSVRTIGGGTLNMGVGVNPKRAGEWCPWQSRLYGVGQSPYMLNTQVATEGQYAFTYGFAAARMKLHRSRGMHSCFWFIQNGQKVPGDPSKGTEVDIAEWFGDNGHPDRGGFGSFIWDLTAENQLRKTGGIFRETDKMKPPGDTWWDSFHVFSVEWTPQEYIFRIDGREYWRSTHAISHTEEYLVLSMLSSDWELGAPDKNMDEKAQVDWVRVWKH